jgi:hypothetical protein
MPRDLLGVLRAIRPAWALNMWATNVTLSFE